MLLLSSAVSVDAKRAIGLGQYLAAGQAVLNPGSGSGAPWDVAEHCTVPIGATLWTVVHEQGERGSHSWNLGWLLDFLPFQCCRGMLSQRRLEGPPVPPPASAAPAAADLSKEGRIYGSGGGGGLSLTERIINRYSHPFFSQHDVLLCASPADEEEEERLVDALLAGAAGGAQAGAPPAGEASREVWDRCDRGESASLRP